MVRRDSLLKAVLETVPMKFRSLNEKAFNEGLALAVPASAQDAPPAGPAPAGPAKGDGAAPPAGPSSNEPSKEPAKKERKVDAKATEAIEKYRKMLHHPTAAGVKQVQARAEITLEMLPEPLVVRPHWRDLGEKGTEFRLDVEVPWARRP